MHKIAQPQRAPTRRAGSSLRLGKGKKRAARRRVSRLCGLFKDMPDLPLERFLEAKAIWRVRGRTAQ